MFDQRARGVLVWHIWESAAYYPRLVRNQHLPRAVVGGIQLTPFFTSKEGVLSKSFVGQQKFVTVALEFDFDPGLSWDQLIETVFDSRHCLLGGCFHCMSP